MDQLVESNPHNVGGGKRKRKRKGRLQQGRQPGEPPGGNPRAAPGIDPQLDPSGNQFGPRAINFDELIKSEEKPDVIPPLMRDAVIHSPCFAPQFAPNPQFASASGPQFQPGGPSQFGPPSRPAFPAGPPASGSPIPFSAEQLAKQFHPGEDRMMMLPWRPGFGPPQANQSAAQQYVPDLPFPALNNQFVGNGAQFHSVVSHRPAPTDEPGLSGGEERDRSPTRGRETRRRGAKRKKWQGGEANLGKDNVYKRHQPFHSETSSQREHGTQRHKNDVKAKDEVSQEIAVFIRNEADKEFTEEDVITFSDSLYELMAEMDVTARFSSTVPCGGYLIVKPADVSSRDWLLRHISKVKAWKGKELKAQKARQVPKEKAIVWVPGVRQLGASDILAFLAKQNRGLPASTWRVLEHKPDATGVLLVVFMDEVSVEFIEDHDMQLYFSANMAQVTFVDRATETAKLPSTASSDCSDTFPTKLSAEGPEIDY